MRRGTYLRESVLALAWTAFLASSSVAAQPRVADPDDATASVTVYGTHNPLVAFNQQLWKAFLTARIVCSQITDDEVTACDATDSSIKSGTKRVVYLFRQADVGQVLKGINDLFQGMKVEKTWAVDSLTLELLTATTKSCTTTCPYNPICQQYPMPRCATKTCNQCGISGPGGKDKDDGKDDRKR